MEKDSNVSDMIHITNNTIEMGNSVLKELNHQREQIDNMNNSLNNINNNISISKNILNKMESLSCRIRSYLFGNKVTNNHQLQNSSTFNITNNHNGNISETDECDVLRNKLQELKNIGLTINDELDEQTALLDNIGNCTNNSHTNLSKLNTRINKF